MNILKIMSQIVIEPEELKIPQSETVNSDTITIVLETVFGIAGAIAMLVIVIAGIRFILGRGDPQKSADARNTIIYAGVGLAIAVLAFSIVRFVVGSV